MAGINWPGLFAWSTRYHDGTAPSQFSVMSDEDRAFLEKAMEEAFGKIENPNDVMKEAIAQIKSENRTDESLATSLEVIDRLCDDPDVARNVEKLDGLQPLFDLVGLASINPSIRLRTLEILALLFSNNPNIQQAGIQRGALQLFLRLAREAPQGSEEKGKAFRALVALVRQMREFETALLRGSGGVDMLTELLQPEEEARTREKAASFITSVACSGGLQEGDVSPLATALARLLSGLGAQGLQHRETMAQSARELARVAPSRCPAALAVAARERLAQLSGPALGGVDDAAAERDALQECVAALEAGPAVSAVDA